jgi:hypothetical protein
MQNSKTEKQKNMLNTDIKKEFLVLIILLSLCIAVIFKYSEWVFFAMLCLLFIILYFEKIEEFNISKDGVKIKRSLENAIIDAKELYKKINKKLFYNSDGKLLGNYLNIKNIPIVEVIPEKNGCKYIIEFSSKVDFEIQAIGKAVLAEIKPVSDYKYEINFIGLGFGNPSSIKTDFYIIFRDYDE